MSRATQAPATAKPTCHCHNSGQHERSNQQTAQPGFETLLDKPSKARRRRVSRAMDAAGDTANSSFAERPRPNSH